MAQRIDGGIVDSDYANIAIATQADRVTHSSLLIELPCSGKARQCPPGLAPGQEDVDRLTLICDASTATHMTANRL
jgi:hypothetical protein